MIIFVKTIGEMCGRVIKTEEEVESFLRQFKPKFKLWGIIFLNRDKNLEALKSLGITPKAREEIIADIRADDYVETILDTIPFGEMWVFGKDYDNTELYIKISIGKPNNNTICISFHVAEHRLEYAFK